MLSAVECAPGPVLAVEGLTHYFGGGRLPFSTGRAPLLRAVEDVSFTIAQGEALSLVGESGCGKSTVARCIAGLYRPTAGHLTFDGIPINPALGRRALASVRRRVQMIFQDPFASLDPRWRVSDIIAEPIKTHRLADSPAAVRARVEELLAKVHLSPDAARKYPHQFSGGQRQRIAIARALASDPHLIVCDEPTSALDVSVQAQVVNLLADLRREAGLTYLIISHNLAVVDHLSDQVGVMYLGRLVEIGPARAVFGAPQHPYTRLLLDAVPDVDLTGRPRSRIGGEVPSPMSPPSGCAFHPRCPSASSICRTITPSVRAVSGRLVACHHAEGV
jgi:peptide/nickel transport system ATP-binding protein